MLRTKQTTKTILALEPLLVTPTEFAGVPPSIFRTKQTKHVGPWGVMGPLGPDSRGQVPPSGAQSRGALGPGRAAVSPHAAGGGLRGRHGPKSCSESSAGRAKGCFPKRQKKQGTFQGSNCGNMWSGGKGSWHCQRRHPLRLKLLHAMVGFTWASW